MDSFYKHQILNRLCTSLTDIKQHGMTPRKAFYKKGKVGFKFILHMVFEILVDPYYELLTQLMIRVSSSYNIYG